MSPLRYIHVFVRVVELQSFSEAGRQLGLAKSAVSKQVNALELELGTQLLTRSTRKLSVTEAGQTYYRYCKKIIELEQGAENELQDQQLKPKGTVRIACDHTFGRLYLARMMSELQRQYSDLKIELLAEDRVINMIEENIDLSVRIGWLQDSNLRAKKLFDSRFILFSSPSYLERCGEPKIIQELTQHDWVNLSLLVNPHSISYRHKKQDGSVPVNSIISSNSVDAVISLVKNGSGISMIAEHAIVSELQSGELMEVLSDYELNRIGVYAVYANQVQLQQKTRVVLQKLVESCALIG